MSDTERYSSNRQFQIWSFTTSHRQLLLRSTKSEGVSTRVDILFKDVALINIPTFLNGIDFEKMEVEKQFGLGPSLHGRIFFGVKSQGFNGHIVAGHVSLHEDAGEYDDPSFLLPSRGI